MKQQDTIPRIGIFDEKMHGGFSSKSAIRALLGSRRHSRVRVIGPDEIRALRDCGVKLIFDSGKAPKVSGRK